MVWKQRRVAGSGLSWRACAMRAPVQIFTRALVPCVDSRLEVHSTPLTAPRRITLVLRIGREKGLRDDGTCGTVDISRESNDPTELEKIQNAMANASA